MATNKQKEAARENIKKAQETWQEMSEEERARRQPEGKNRKEPGTGGEGDYFHIEVRDSDNFETFRTHDVGNQGGLQRVAGQRKSGSWDTVKWLVSKDFAHVQNDELIPDHEDAKSLFDKFDSKPEHIKGDIFKAKPRPNVAEEDKPTEAQQKARQENIKKAQAERHH